MSSIKGQSTYDNTRHLNYISTAPFGDNIFTYTTSVNSAFTTIGQIQSLLSLGTVSAGTAPAGRILRTNSRKLFPGANPCSTIITVGSGTQTVTQLYSQMVGVIDVVSGLSGFIDPNDSLFAIYNVDKAIDYPNDGSTPAHLAHKGPSLYTAGNVTADLNIVTNNGAIGVDVAAGAAGTITSAAGITANTGNIVATAGNIVATAGNIVATAGNIVATAGKIVLSSAVTTSGASPQAAGSASIGTATLVAGAMVVNTTAVTAASKIFITRRGPSSGGMYLEIDAQNAGTSFTVKSYNASNTLANTDVNAFDWLIIN